MINFGKVLLRKSQITLKDMKQFMSLPIDSNNDQIPIYSYDENIKIVTTYDLEQSTKHIPIKDQVIHSIAHIEYNAMKSYIDTLIRFINQVPLQFQIEFKEDLGQIAYEEFCHFELVNQLCKYGSQPVHNNLQKRMILTTNSLLGRLAVLSIVNEGRGMDTGLNLIQKLEGDKNYEKVIKKIVQEESNHVKIGLKWFELLCSDQSPQENFLKLMNDYKISRNWKINIQKRKQVGFSDEWIKCLQNWN
ncbi:unnamed protein product (macronuclear) [Paramecium tetraurelia]|uniref:Uncharacterized protein n=1 Tax=Paramecium tetraurelia TaxID=5888 RepID=A0BNK4_PARTE|nr:uncharacterized protein GSPATT00030759001 [Paramecium tetraurelia]CAK60121.1 unnamed protein product [Paramecium tetraurelia]|eukprot:XP_001427519.1 hypothetical protein (macronuclear) [Paramecium tetraurelia strain d4-2]